MDAIPKLKPLIADIKKLNIGEYLKSTDFERYAIKNNFESAWDEAYKKAKNSRSFISVDFDHKSYDCENALTYIAGDG